MYIARCYHTLGDHFDIADPDPSRKKYKLSAITTYVFKTRKLRSDQSINLSATSWSLAVLTYNALPACVSLLDKHSTYAFMGTWTMLMPANTSISAKTPILCWTGRRGLIKRQANHCKYSCENQRYCGRPTYHNVGSSTTRNKVLASIKSTSEH